MKQYIFPFSHHSIIRIIPSFIIKLVHRPVDALQAERRNDLGGHFKALVNLFFLLIGTLCCALVLLVLSSSGLLL